MASSPYYTALSFFKVEASILAQEWYDIQTQVRKKNFSKKPPVTDSTPLAV